MAKRKRPAARRDDLVLQALHAIRAEQAKTNERLDKTNERLDKTVEHLGHTVDRLDRLERRVTEGFLETNTKLADLSGRFEASIKTLGDRLENLLTGQLGQDVRDLKNRVHVLEERSLVAHERPPPYGEPR